jgi:hypothetical protein
MKRFCRWMFNGLTAIAAVVCVVTVFAWVRGFFTAPALTWVNSTGTGRWAIRCSMGEMEVDHVVNNAPGQYSPKWGGLSFTEEQPFSIDQTFRSLGSRVHFDFRIYGLGHGQFQPQPPRGGIRVAFLFWPCWAAVLITLPVPVLYAIRRRRVAEGHCRICGYDLRATPECCPECGRIPEKLA